MRRTSFVSLSMLQEDSKRRSGRRRTKGTTSAVAEGLENPPSANPIQVMRRREVSISFAIRTGSLSALSIHYVRMEVAWSKVGGARTVGGEIGLQSFARACFTRVRRSWIVTVRRYHCWRIAAGWKMGRRGVLG